MEGGVPPWLLSITRVKCPQEAINMDCCCFVDTKLGNTLFQLSKELHRFNICESEYQFPLAGPQAHRHLHYHRARHCSPIIQFLDHKQRSSLPPHLQSRSNCESFHCSFLQRIDPRQFRYSYMMYSGVYCTLRYIRRTCAEV
jgi:hypothetical protein